MPIRRSTSRCRCWPTPPPPCPRQWTARVLFGSRSHPSRPCRRDCLDASPGMDRRRPARRRRTSAVEGLRRHAAGVRQWILRPARRGTVTFDFWGSSTPRRNWRSSGFPPGDLPGTAGGSAAEVRNTKSRSGVDCQPVGPGGARGDAIGDSAVVSAICCAEGHGRTLRAYRRRRSRDVRPFAVGEDGN